MIWAYRGHKQLDSLWSVALDKFVAAGITFDRSGNTLFAFCRNTGRMYVKRI